MTGRIMLLALGAALGMAPPAAAQDSVAGVAASASLPPGAVTVRNISHVELSAGVPIVDDSGKTIGTVKKVAGNTIIVTDGAADYLVPITQLYAYNDGTADHFASRLPKSALEPGRAGG